MDNKFDEGLHRAAFEGDFQACVKFINSGKFDVNGHDGQGYTPLHAAAQYKHKAVVGLLLMSGAEVNSLDNWGNTPLWRALGGDDEHTKAVIDLLLEAGADPNIENNHGVSVVSHVNKIKAHKNYDQLKKYIIE